MKNMKKLIAVLLNITLLLSGASAFAGDESITESNKDTEIIITEEVASGTCGDNLTWVLDSRGTLTISGTGDMTDWSYSSSAPWYIYRSSITSVIIESGVTSIGDYAFHNCDSLTSITIPDSVTNIGDCAFSGCSSLISIEVDENNQNYCSVDGNLFNKDKTELIQYAIGKTDTQYIIPDSVTSIGSSAFKWCSNLTSVTIPNSVTSIGEEAFFSCSSLTSVVIGNGVTSIGEEAFRNCENLTSITMPGIKSLSKIFTEVPDTLTKVTITSGAIPDEFALGCTNIARVTIKDGVESIGVKAFYNCTNLRYLNIEEGCNKIYQSAFAGCKVLSEVTIPNSVTSIVGAGVFPTGTVIKGYTGSVAEEYADNYGYIFKNIDAENAVTLSSAERLNGNIVIATSTDVDLSDKVLHIALYNNNDEMIDYIMVPTKLSENTAYIVLKNNPSASYAKVFVWNSITSMIPTGNVEKVNIL